VATQTPLKVTVAWPPRTRAIQAPGSALSCVVSLANANPKGGAFTFEIDRGATLTAFTQTYTSSTSALTGPSMATITFYAAAGGTGSVVANAHSNVTVATDGTGLDQVAVTGTVSKLFIPANQTVAVGSSTQLTFEAYDSSNTLIALSPGSAGWTCYTGTSFLSLTPSGVATGRSVGGASVYVAVDGITSQGALISVTGVTMFGSPTMIPSIPMQDAGTTIDAVAENGQMVGEPFGVVLADSYAYYWSSPSATPTFIPTLPACQHKYVPMIADIGNKVWLSGLDNYLSDYFDVPYVNIFDANAQPGAPTQLSQFPSGSQYLDPTPSVIMPNGVIGGYSADAVGTKLLTAIVSWPTIAASQPSVLSLAGGVPANGSWNGGDSKGDIGCFPGKYLYSSGGSILMTSALGTFNMVNPSGLIAGVEPVGTNGNRTFIEQVGSAARTYCPLTSSEITQTVPTAITSTGFVMGYIINADSSTSVYLWNTKKGTAFDVGTALPKGWTLATSIGGVTYWPLADGSIVTAATNSAGVSSWVYFPILP